MNEEQDRAALGARLKTAREYRGLSQEDVAKYLGIPRPAVSLLEAGTRKVEALELKRLAEFFSCSMEDLTGAPVGSAVPQSVEMIARATAGLSPEDRAEVLQFAQFLRSRRAATSKP